MFKFLILDRTRSLSFDCEDNNIAEALETIYVNKPNLLLIWNGIEIKMSFAYDFSAIMYDLKKMFNELRLNSKEFKIYWGSSSFFCQWNFSVDKNIISIFSYWTSVVGDINSLRKDENNQIKIGKNEFLNEWKKLLFILEEDLRFSGYSEKNLEDYSFLTDNSIREES